MHRLYAIAAGSALAFCAANSEAAGEQFTFHVPVRIENATPIISANVACAVQDERSTIGSGRTAIPLSGGAFHGTLTVAFNLGSEHSPLAARRYYCTIELRARDRAGFEFGSGYMAIETDYSRNTGQELVELVPVAQGDLPR